MLKDALKNYMYSYIKVYLKECGTYPQVDAEMTEESSICFFGEQDEDGYIQWNYVEQPAPIDFDKVEQKHHIQVRSEVKWFYHSYLFPELQGFLDGSEEGHIFFEPVMEETEELFFPSDAFPATEEYLNFIIIGTYGKIDASLCVDIVTGKVYSWDLCEDTYEFQNEGRFKAPELLADSLTELFLRLLSFRK